MNLSFAQRCADRLLEWLAPFADRIEVAGSLRRGKSVVGDIDLVVIPKQVTEQDLFGTTGVTRNVTWKEIDRRATADGWTLLRAGAEIVSWTTKGVQVDVFWTTHEHWGTALMQRTGSKEHNIWLSNYAVIQGGKWHPNVGLYLRNKRFSQTEEEIYQAIGLSFIPPEKREAHLLPFASLTRPGAARLLCS
jgi:DNA polymerase (family X)